MPIARKITRIGIPRRDENELNKMLLVINTEPRMNRLIIAVASKVHVLLIFVNGLYKKVTIFARIR